MVAMNSRPSRTRSALTAVAALCALFLASCTSEAPPPAVDDVTVSGPYGSAPTLAYSQPLTIPKPRTEVVWEGEGPVAAEGDVVLLHLYGQNGEDGSQVVNTYGDLPQTFRVTTDELSASMYEAVAGRPAGSRVLVVEEDAGTPVALVIDTLAGRASGTPVEVPEGLPVVTDGADGAPEIAVPEGDAPTSISVQPIVRGEGTQVREGQTVIVQYTAITWSDGAVFDSTWAPDRAPFTTIVGDSKPILAWDAALIEQTVGSRVLLVAPPDTAYGGSDTAWAEETVVFVIDILYAGTLAAPDDDGERASDEGESSPGSDEEEDQG